MIRGNFHIFACRSGEVYAAKVAKQLRSLSEERIAELKKKASLSMHARDELEFMSNMAEQKGRLGNAKVMHFDDGEMNILLDHAENVRDKDVFLVQCPYNIINGLTLAENVMETFFFLDALQRAKAHSVTLISLYFPFGRGDKQHGKSGVPGKVFAELLTSSGMNNLITMDLHADQITGFFDPLRVRVENLQASPLLVHYFKKIMPVADDAKFAAPDAGAAKRAQSFAQALERGMIMAYKKRSYEKKHTIDALSILGLPGKGEVIITDDIVASGGSVFKVMEQLKEKGVKKVVVACTHPLLIRDAIPRFDELFKDRDHPFSLLIGTDAVPHNEDINGKEWYVEVDTSRFIAKAIYEMHTSGSLSILHDPHCVEKLGLWP